LEKYVAAKTNDKLEYEKEYFNVIKQKFINVWMPKHKISDQNLIKKVEKIDEKLLRRFHLDVIDLWSSTDEMLKLFKDSFKIDLKPQKINANDMMDIVKLEKSFSETTLDKRAVEYILKRLSNLAYDFDRTHWYYPGTAIVQSSGAGKSRSIVALEEYGLHLVYCSFMKGNGFPRKSEIAPIIQDGNDVTFARYYYACLEVIKHFVVSFSSLLACRRKMERSISHNYVSARQISSMNSGIM
jgi:hypothetical protein